MTDLHSTKAFDTDLQDLGRMVAEMGGLAEKQVADSVDALAKRDSALATRITQADANIDALQREIEEKAVLTIARRQPMAVDLREIVGALRLAGDLERIGDLAKNMSRMVLEQMKTVLDSYARRDVSKAMAVWRGDEEIDAVYTSVFRELLTYMIEDPRNITSCIHLLFCAKNIERMGDHATNIAESVHYVIDGRPIADLRPKGDTTTIAALRVGDR